MGRNGHSLREILQWRTNSRVLTEHPPELPRPPGNNAAGGAVLLRPAGILMSRLAVMVFLLSAAFACGAEELWSLRPLARAVLKRGGIDAFIDAELAAHGLHRSPRADARTLARRASVDLTGLPPSSSDMPGVAEMSDQSYARLIDRLLASPHYGEQWARHWLDVARYSDTKGYVYAREEKRWVHASAYRDWVVRALNEDMPYDRFVRLQIAADQLVPGNSPDLAAMGFLTLGRRFLGVTHDIIDDRIDVVTRGMLGLTVACARCHDHKFDPVSTRDYYSLYGVFQSSAEALVPCGKGDDSPLAALIKNNRELLTKRRAEQEARTRERLGDYLDAQSALDKYPPEGFDQILEEKDLNPFIVHRFATWLKKHDLSTARMKAMPPEERTRLLAAPDSPVRVPDEHVANIEMYFPSVVTNELWKSQGDVDKHLLAASKAPPFATILQDRAQPSTPRVFIRGNPLNRGDEVPRRFLPALTQGRAVPFTRGSGRFELAEAIADPRNPLTARVIVNRVWMHHFGRGLVATPSDFGKRAAPPSHPALLDYLALRLIDSGWSLKALHREIMLSQTYQQDSVIADSRDTTAASRESGERSGRADVKAEIARLKSAQAVDPDNHLLWRMTAHRLTFEEARDTWLAASGEMDLRIGGRPEPLFARGNMRRTLYAMVDRENVPAVMRTFDFANPDLSIPQRNETTVPQQALFGMNHPFVVSRASAITARWSTTRMNDEARVRDIYSRLYQRRPNTAEMEAALAFVRSADVSLAKHDEPSAWSYGYGEFDESAGHVKSFTPLPHFTGAAWQGGDDWPDAKLGWARLTAMGGHPGNDRKHAVVRRWTAPQTGTYAFVSKLIHEPEAGDGIRAFVSLGSRGLLRSAVVHHATEEIDLDAIVMNKGDTLDFIVDIRDGLNNDQFLWSPKISTGGLAGSGGDLAGQTWNSEKDFAGESTARLDPWQQLVQVLMLANEFLFVD